MIRNPRGRPLRGGPDRRFGSSYTHTVTRTHPPVTHTEGRRRKETHASKHPEAGGGTARVNGTVRRGTRPGCSGHRRPSRGRRSPFPAPLSRQTEV